MWEIVTSVSTALTTIILLLTVVLGRRQIDLVRRSTQLDGLFRVLRQLDTPEMRRARAFVVDELPAVSGTAAFRDALARNERTEALGHCRQVMGMYEELGAYVVHGLLDRDIVYCQAGAAATRCWGALADVVAIDRARNGPGVWDSYERLVTGTIAYYRRMNPNFPGPYRAHENARALSSAAEAQPATR